jgi:hypothetical protein
MLRRIFGPLVFLLGLGLAVWIIYNLFIVRTPYAKGSPRPAIVLSVAALGVGWKWMRGEQAG